MGQRTLHVGMILIRDIVTFAQVNFNQTCSNHCTSHEYDSLGGKHLFNFHFPKVKSLKKVIDFC